MAKQACTAHNILDDLQSTRDIFNETWHSLLFIFLTYLMTYTIYPSIICFRKIPKEFWNQSKTNNTLYLLRFRTGFAIFVMLLFYAGTWLGFCLVIYRAKQKISYCTSSIITSIRFLCIFVILIDSITNGESVTASIIDCLIILVLGFTHGVMVYYHLSMKPNLKDVTLQYQD